MAIRLGGLEAERVVGNEAELRGIDTVITGAILVELHPTEALHQRQATWQALDPIHR